GLQVAAPTTAAEPSAVLHDGVANLARRAGGAAPYLPALHDGGADASADEDADEIIIVVARAEMILAVAGDLHIVADDHGRLELGTEQTAQVKILQSPRQIGGGEQNTFSAIHLARDADAHADDGRYVGQCRRGERLLADIAQALGEEVHTPLWMGTFAGGGKHLARVSID